VPEGDTIHHHANRIRPVLEGAVPDALLTPHPRFARDRWPERLAGRTVRSVDAHGKHLFLRFDGGLTIHSHLRMSGTWAVRSRGEAWPRPPRSAWLVVRRGAHEVVQFHGPVLELLTDLRTRSDPRIARLGPDVVAAGFDPHAVLARLRRDDPTRPIGDALLDQRIVAGIGNLWKVEGCWLARVDPWRPAGDVADEEVLRILEEVRPRMRESARTGNQSAFRTIYGTAGQPCPRCGAAQRIHSRGQGDGNRLTYWCPGCQS
jgi:endonuclease VIII